jgi:ATP-dependent Clp protease adaptor protein ClpS
MTDKMQGKPLADKSSGNNSDTESFLILHNDDVHSFDYVIESLIEICGHTSVQAEQCTFIVHYKGMCEVKKGKRKTLERMQMNLVKKGLKASIE